MMRKFVSGSLVWAIWIWLPVCLLGQQGAAPGSQVLGPHVVIVPLDRGGSPVDSLSKESIKLEIQGKPAEIEGVQALRQQPMVFSLLVDVSGSADKFTKQRVEGASKIFRLLSTDQNRGFLIAFDGAIRSNDRPMTPNETDQILQRMQSIPRQPGTVIYDAIEHAIDRQVGESAVPGSLRRVVILLSDGEDNSSHLTLDATVRAAQRECVPIVSVGFTEKEDWTRPKSKKMALRTFETLSHGTGGLVTFLDAKEDVIGRLPSLLEAQEEVIFKGENLEAGKSYSVKLESTIPNVAILSPRNYIAR